MPQNKQSPSFLSIVKNNLFVLNLAWRISKLRFVTKLCVTIFASILPSVSILVTRYMISLLESDYLRTDYMLNSLYTVLIALAGVMLLPRIFSVFNDALIEPILASRINNHINEVFFDKARTFEYKKFEDPAFYDKLTRAFGQAEGVAHSAFNSLFQLVGGILSLTALSAIIIMMDGVIILFVMVSVAINFFQSILSGKLGFTTSQILTPISRTQNYVKNILYNAGYAKEVKCNDVIGTGKRYYFESFCK